MLFLQSKEYDLRTRCKMERKTDWDFLKAVLMLVVVFGHICPANPSTWTPVTRVTGLFAMPLFFFVSGYFQTNITDVNKFYVKFKKICLRILVPQLSWGCIYVILSLFVFFPIVEISDISSFLINIFDFLKYSPYYIAGFYWFLSALFICLVIGSIVLLVYSYSNQLGFILMFVSPILFCLLPSDPYHFTFVWFFYVSGIVYKKKEYYMQFCNNTRLGTIVILTLSIVVVYLGLHFYPEKTFYYKSNLFSKSPFNVIVYRFCLCYASSMLAFYWIMNLYNTHKDNKIIEWFASSGQNSLFIYCSHMLFLEFIYNPLFWNVYNRDEFSSNPHLGFYIFGVIVSVLLYYSLNYLCILLKKKKICRIMLLGIV